MHVDSQFVVVLPRCIGKLGRDSETAPSRVRRVELLIAHHRQFRIVLVFVLY